MKKLTQQSKESQQNILETLRKKSYVFCRDSTSISGTCTSIFNAKTQGSLQMYFIKSGQIWEYTLKHSMHIAKSDAILQRTQRQLASPLRNSYFCVSVYKCITNFTKLVYFLMFCVIVSGLLRDRGVMNMRNDTEMK